MTIRICLLLITALLMAACDDDVPQVSDPEHPVDHRGNPIKASEFMEKYCLGKTTNETCTRVRVAAAKNASKGGLPKGW